MVATEPLSDNRARFYVVSYAICTAMAGLIVGMFLFPFMQTGLWWLIGAVNVVLAAFYATMLVWSVQGLMYRRDKRREAEDLKTFLEIVKNAV